MNTRAEVTKTDTDIVGAIEKGANTISNNVSNALKEYNNSLQSAISGAISNAYNAGRSSVPSYSYTPSSSPGNSGKIGGEGKKNPPKNYCPENKWYASSYGNQITTGLEKTGSQVFVTDKNGKKTWQNIWHNTGASKTDIGSYLIWHGKVGKYVKAADYIPSFFPGRLEKYYDKRGKAFSQAGAHTPVFKKGGLADFTGPAWLDGTKTNPEAVLNAEQTKAFMSLVNSIKANTPMLENMCRTNGNISIDNISFNVDSMSSVEDGKKAFDAFVQEFKKIGQQQGLYINRKV